MTISDAQKRARNKWDAEHMEMIGVKCKKTVKADFKIMCERNNTNMNAVLLDYIRRYIETGGAVAATLQQQDANN